MNKCYTLSCDVKTNFKKFTKMIKIQNDLVVVSFKGKIMRTTALSVKSTLDKIRPSNSIQLPLQIIRQGIHYA